MGVGSEAAQEVEALPAPMVARVILSVPSTVHCKVDVKMRKWAAEAPSHQTAHFRRALKGTSHDTIVPHDGVASKYIARDADRDHCASSWTGAGQF
jgi:hypothetical protein